MRLRDHVGGFTNAAGLQNYCALMPANLTTLAHFSVCIRARAMRLWPARSCGKRYGGPLGSYIRKSQALWDTPIPCAASTRLTGAVASMTANICARTASSAVSPPVWLLLFLM
jgi:hypothetical protein